MIYRSEYELLIAYKKSIERSCFDWRNSSKLRKQRLVKVETKLWEMVLNAMKKGLK